MQRKQISSKPLQFTESVIREMTRQALLHNAVNLSQGFPDFPAPPEIKAATRHRSGHEPIQHHLGIEEPAQAVADRLQVAAGLTLIPKQKSRSVVARPRE